MAEKLYIRYGKVFFGIMTIISMFLTIVHIEGTKYFKASNADLSDFDEEGWGVVFALLGLAIVALVFIKGVIPKYIGAGIALLEIILFFIFTFTGDLHDGIKNMDKADMDWHWGAGWWMLMISIIGFTALAVIDALPDFLKFLNSRPAPAPQQYYQQPMQQPYAQPMQPMQQPYAQPQQPVAQPMQQPVAQPVQQPIDPNAQA